MTSASSLLSTRRSSAPATGLPAAPAQPVAVTAVLVVHDGATWLSECLDALSLQSRPLDRLVVVDTGSTDCSLRIVARHVLIRQVVGDVSVSCVPRDSTFGQAVGRAVGLTTPRSEVSQPAIGAEWLWLLHDDSAADPDALAHLLDAGRRSPSVGVVGPKLVTWDDPSRLLSLGWVITRSGRQVGGPASGTPDQGQHDHRYDVLGVSTSGMLIRREVFDSLKGFDLAFSQFCDDLDLCWRAHLAGHRVVVAPKARMREAAASTNGQRSPDLSADAALRRRRRSGRQVALARCSPYVAPFLALWIAVACLGSAVALLVAKRPRRAWVALGDLASVLGSGRPLAARWRARGIHRVRRRDLRGVFASPKAGLDDALGATYETLAVGSGGSLRGAHDVEALEGGQAGEDARLLQRGERSLGRRALSHPGFLAVLAGVLLAAVMWRSLFGALVPGGPGLAGGELLPVSSSSGELWHAWLDGWHGAGLGNAVEQPAYLPSLAASAWVLEHLPLLGSPSSSSGASSGASSSVGVVIAWLLAAAVPISAWTAYLAARVLTRAPWPRAWVALAWASLATLTTAVGGGRLGAVIAHILMPLVAAGFVRAAQRSAPTWLIVAAAAGLGVIDAVNPAFTALGALAALLLFVVGHGRTRRHAAVLLLLPIGLLGPWILRLVDDPSLVLAGPGLTVWQGAVAEPWQLALLHPGGPGSYPVLLSAPILLAGVVAMSRREVDSVMMTTLAGVAVAGLGLGLAAPHLVIGSIPQGMAGAGGPITVWPGTGLDLAALALLAAVLCWYDKSSRRFSPVGWYTIGVLSVVTAAILGVVGSVVMGAWFGVGTALRPQVPDIPAVAADQARGPGGHRLLAMSRSADGNTIEYRLVGAEPGPVVRDLPGLAQPPDPLLAAAVRSTVAHTDVAAASAPWTALAELGVGFVGFRGKATEPLVTALDATGGLTRLGNSRGLILWRVLPREGTSGSSRLRLVDALGAPVATVAVTGAHGQAEVDVGAPASGAPASGAPAGERRLVVAEPPRWADLATVSFAGRRLEATAGAGQPTYRVPPESGQLSIALTPTHQWWRRGQLVLLLLVLFLAAPFGSRSPARLP